MSATLKIAIAAEFELAEKITDVLAQSELDNAQLFIIEIYPFNEEQGIRFNNKAVPQLIPEEVDFTEFNYLLFAGDHSQLSQLTKAANSGCVVIDLKGTSFELDSSIPLVIPSVNDEELENVRYRNIISLPDPQVSQVALGIASIISSHEPSSIFVTSLLPTSYISSDSVSQLAGQTAKLLNGIPLDEEEQRLAFDVSPLAKDQLAYQLALVLRLNLENIVFHQIQVPVFYGLAQQISLTINDYAASIEPETLISAWQAYSDIDYKQDGLITPVINGEKESGEDGAKLHISQLNVLENRIQLWAVTDEQRFNIAQLGCKLLLNLYNQGY